MPRWVRLAALATFAALGTACSGGSGRSLPAPAPAASAPGGTSQAPGSAGEIRVTASFGKTGPLQLSPASQAALARTRRRALSGTFASFEFTGTLYPGYAGAAPVMAHVIQNGSSLPSSVQLAFTNVPVGNNEWVLIDVTGFDSQNAGGSSVDLGELGGLLNATSSSQSITVDSGATLRLQLALSAMEIGMISTYDLTNETSLDSDLGNFIGQATPSTNPSTGVYSNQTLATLLGNLDSKYERTLAVDGSIATASTAWVTWDYTNASELNYSSNVGRTYQTLTPIDQSTIGVPMIYGNPNAQGEPGAFIGPHVPSAGTNPLPFVLIAQGADAPNGTATFANVYGGALKVGVSSQPVTTSNSLPDYGGFASVGGRATGSSSSVNVSVGTSSVSFTNADNTVYNDNTGALYGIPAFANPYQFEIKSLGPQSLEAVCSGPCHGMTNIPYLSAVSSSGGTINFDNFNPWGLPSSSFQYCDDGSGECLPLVANGTLTTHTPFYDSPDTDTYTIGPAGGATTSVTHSQGGGYTVNYSGGTNGYIQWSPGTYVFNAGQQLTLVSIDAPLGTTYYLNACGYNQVSSGGTFVLQSIPGLISCTTPPTLGYSFPAGSATSGSFTISAFEP